jgi:hypothetical protein
LFYNGQRCEVVQFVAWLCVGSNHPITISLLYAECKMCLLQEDTGGPGGGVASSNIRGFAHKRKVKASQLSVRQGICSLTKSQQNFHLRNICTYKREVGTCHFAEQQNNNGIFSS